MKSVFILFCTIFFIGCGGVNTSNDRQVIDVSVQDKKNAHLATNDTIQDLKVAVAAMISSKETFIYYEELFNYISRKLNYQIEFIQRKTYKEVNQMLSRNEVDLAFICTGAYVLGKKNCNLELLVVPVCYGKPFYQSYIIVPKSSTITSFSGLKGKAFAYTDPLSNTGKLFADMRVKELGFKKGYFFGSVVYSSAHDISIQLISKGVIDGACVDGLIYEYMLKHHPENVSQIKIIEKSEYFGIPPVVVPANLKKEIKEKLKKTLTTLHEDPEGKKIIDKLSIDKFIYGNEANYIRIENMIRYINE